MKPLDPFRFLVFHRGATERIAASYWSLLVGALLVVTAGIARNYDHLDLARDREWLLGPFAMSLFTSLWIFPWVVRLLGLPTPGLHRQWGVFLTFFWMTSPCAWLYAIPVERWMDLADAARWNVAFLVAVSCWRVALIAFALRVLTGNHWWRCALAVLLPAAIEMGVALFFKRTELVGIMGGVRISPENSVLLTAASTILTICIVGGAVLLIIHAGYGTSIAKTRNPIEAPVAAPSRFPTVALALASALVALAVAAAHFTVQPSVRLTRQFDRLADEGDWEAVLELASHTTTADYSPYHFFPPRPYGYGPLRRIVDTATQFGDRAPDWLLDEWHRNALLAIGDEPLNRYNMRMSDFEGLRAWFGTANGKAFLTTHRDRILALAPEDSLEAFRDIYEPADMDPGTPESP